MKLILQSLAISMLTVYACGKTKTVIREGAVPPVVPIEKPTAPIPPITKPSDSTLQNDEVEQYALTDALTLNAADAANTVYLSGANFQNFGDSVSTAMKGTELGLNLLSSRAFISKVRPVDPAKSIWAVDLRDYFGSKGGVVFKAVEDNAVIKIVSQTSRFKNLQFLTQKQIPLMHAQIFLETAFKAALYYSIKGVPLLEDDFWIKQRVNRQKLFDDRDSSILLAGFSDSQIAPDHNRVIRRMEGKNGVCYDTSDVDAANVLKESNYFLFPFPPEARSAQTLKQGAREILCRQANGLWVGALYNGLGQRADVAPTTVVVNTRTSALGLDPSIAPRDCAGCHVNFAIAAKDDIGRTIKDNPFAASDKLLGQIFYKSQAQIDQQMAADNRDHGAAVDQLGITVDQPDPMNTGVIDKMRDGYTAKELAAFLYLTEADFLQRLAGSQSASQEVGQLLQGGSIGFIQLQASMQKIIDDLNLFRDVE
jgi:hypothetical protein